GGAWEATEALLTDGGMQWAYSELFQNFSPREISTYLDHSVAQSTRVGLLTHYSETHDNERLAARGRNWSLLRNRLCALTSASGGFGFTCGVEWLAPEKIDVHESTGLAWGTADNLAAELAALNRLLAEHPCFFDGAKLERLSSPESPVCALRRQSAEGKDSVLILVNTDPAMPQKLSEQGLQPPADATGNPDLRALKYELLGQTAPEIQTGADGKRTLVLPAGAAYCLSDSPTPKGLSGEAYRRMRAAAAWAIEALAAVLPSKALPLYAWRELASLVENEPSRFLAAVSILSERLEDADDHHEFLARFSSIDFLKEMMAAEAYPPVVLWTLSDRNRVLLVAPHHWLLLQDTSPFRATLRAGTTIPQHVESIASGKLHIAFFPPTDAPAEAMLTVERYHESDRKVSQAVRFLPSEAAPAQEKFKGTDLLLVTNGRGAMARMRLDLGLVESKYDCVLGANLHPTLPVDRHVFVKRMRVWLNAAGFISPLDIETLDTFQPGPPGVWKFMANAGDGRTVELLVRANMLPDRNTTAFQFARPTAADATGKQVPAGADVRLTLRFDIEDRSFHSETHRNGGADFHFNSNTHPYTPAQSESASAALGNGGHKVGFAFTPAPERQLRVFCHGGAYHPQPEWSENIPHPVEQSRAQVGSGDAFSPGWFEIPLPPGKTVTVVVCADAQDPSASVVEQAFASGIPSAAPGSWERAGVRGRTIPNSETSTNSFGEQLLHSTRAFLVKRDSGKTIIAGYPWFLDWGRDTFICARGLISAGLLAEVEQLVLTFARFEQNGTLPNTIFGSDASNRDTSDAPLWFGVVCEELAEALGGMALYDKPVNESGRKLRDVLQSIAVNYCRGTPNGIRMDPGSGLIWSPSHFTWMDTNYPACTPREGYPVEIQALWIRLLRHLDRAGIRPEAIDAAALADQAMQSLQQFFWSEAKGWFADLLVAAAGQPATKAVADDCLRSNALFLVSLGLVTGAPARRQVDAALRYLVVPGALRSLAPLKVSVPLPNVGNDGRLLNDPTAPYWGHYEGDEDTRRKPAYHNGTAWTWTFPVFCEALARAWDFAPDAVAAARAYLGSMRQLLDEGCLGYLPEILDGDAPHQQRGCDAQAWASTEALRVWTLLSQPGCPNETSRCVPVEAAGSSQRTDGDSLARPTASKPITSA
ncbi:MAG TPA: amylo-alpha-1,6-glucosidase, partial [Candidatus Dormibacteraeota bacterium]|nr:amylo-alpha-1,6-glucosidase [Candidatus Dormibacteraeota bacterium]